MLLKAYSTILMSSSAAEQMSQITKKQKCKIHFLAPAPQMLIWRKKINTPMKVTDENFLLFFAQGTITSPMINLNFGKTAIFQIWGATQGRGPKCTKMHVGHLFQESLNIEAPYLSKLDIPLPLTNTVKDQLLFESST